MTINAPAKEQLGQLRGLWQEAFGDTDAFLDSFFDTAFSPERCRCVSIDGSLAAALYWFRCSHMGRPVAYIYAVATAKSHRKQGLCRRLMEDTHAHLARLDYEGAVLVPAGEDLMRMYGAMGYEVFGGAKEFDCSPGDQQISVRRVDKEVYARLRRERLPSGSIVQEGENLDFLQTQADFYAGADFLLAARQDKDLLTAVELLGNADAAPRILRTLGCTSGSFRTPGDTPFAMYRPLGESTLPKPSYFGFAFD